MMRSVSFVERLELEFSGNLLQNSLVLGDADNDGFNELLMGTASGELYIFKGKHTKPWMMCSGLGMITCIGVSDILNIGRNSVFVLSSEGWCYIFNLSKTQVTEQGKWDFSGCPVSLKPEFTQHLTANSKVLLLADVDGDGQCEVLVGHTDRIVHMYKWVIRSTDQESKITATLSTPASQDSAPSKGSGKDQKQRKHSKDSDADSRPATPTTTDKDGLKINGQFECVDRWQLNGQIGSFALYQNSQKENQLLVSQPGGSFIVLKGSQTEEHVNNPEGLEQDIFSESRESGPLRACYPLSTLHVRNPNVPTEIVGQLQQQLNTSQDLLTMCTLDGTLVLLDNEQKVVWSLQVDHSLFSLAKLDINRDGNEEVVVCAWDGMTYIVDHKRTVVKFKFAETVSAFTAGSYALEPTHNVPSLVYASFSNHIYIYWNVELTNLSPTTLLDKMTDQLRDSGMSVLLSKISDEDGKVDTSKLKKLSEWCLYGWNNKTWSET